MTKFTLLVTALLFTCTQLFAQIQMPQPSPNASVMQMVGLTAVTVEYSSPGIKGRKVYGDLVPYDKAWRAGANSPTKITFSKDVKVEGSMLKAGSYNVFITPMQKGKWLMHFNGAGNSVYAYEKDGKQDMDALKKDDVLTLAVEPMKMPERERLAYHIEAIDENSGKVTMHWAKEAVSFTFTTDTDAHALESIKTGMAEYNGMWYTFSNTAEYYLDNNQDVDQAMDWAKKGLALRGDHFYPTWVMAKAMAAKGETKEAKKMAKEAMKMGEENGGNFYANRKDSMKKTVKSW